MRAPVRCRRGRRRSTPEPSPRMSRSRPSWRRPIQWRLHQDIVRLHPHQVRSFLSAIRWDGHMDIIRHGNRFIPAGGRTPGGASHPKAVDEEFPLCRLLSLRQERRGRRRRHRHRARRARSPAPSLVRRSRHVRRARRRSARAGPPRPIRTSAISQMPTDTAHSSRSHPERGADSADHHVRRAGQGRRAAGTRAGLSRRRRRYGGCPPAGGRPRRSGHQPLVRGRGIRRRA